MTARRWSLALLSLPLLLGACGAPSDPEQAPTEPPPTSPAEPLPTRGETVTVDLADRPFPLHVPGVYDPAEPAPLVVLLHGFQADGMTQEAYFRLTAESERRGFLYAVPDGSLGQADVRFWNASPACCDFGGTGVDDSGYLRDLLDRVTAEYSVDHTRVYLVGHSNGGFMAYRAACDHASEITAIVSLAGAAIDPADCAPERPVSVLQIHGTEDDTIRFDGGANLGRPYPSVEQTLAQWREHNSCSAQTADSPDLDLDLGLPGEETAVTSYPDCAEQSRVELWRIEGGGHVPPLTADFAPAVLDFLYAQTRP
ncbi:alpha/beta fold hydrolase [Natronosporangium hydrolyticum]|uniref:Alpha/beta fold hydrolase n=1 Tax=Natronosporangium hydrolyticum TaxID=2811111 RepID=A0A895Y4Z7_9ACTN|nr:alpha/beta fold hydrolase [Natronosporangium hydrolyticum]QSB12774.1 alpha/beta fold hydrolase [Natronosporangium hydrolyticum]